MIRKYQVILAAILAAFFVAPADAQNAGTVSNHAIPIGKEAGVQGFGSLALTSGQVIIGQTSADPQAKTLTGDVTVNSSGVTAIGSSKVTNSQLATMAANTTKCNTTAGSANPTDCNAATMRTNIGVVIGTNVEAWDADLDCIAALSSTGQIKRTGSGTCSAGSVALSDLSTGTQDTVIGYFGSTTATATAISNCTGALTYSTTTHTFGCNTSGGTGTVTSVACGTGLSGGTITTTGTCALALTNATLQANPGNPSGTTSGTAVMAGMGGVCKLTPIYSTRIHITFQAQISNSTSAAFAVMGMRYGTGTAPANGAAATGTIAANEISYQTSAVNSFAPFSSTAIITGLTPGTAYWFDLTQRQISGGTAYMQSVGCTAMEF
jgi:hypothetical protein